MTTIAIPNAMTPSPELLCGGQPSDAQIAAAAADGFTTLINLRPDNEMAACGIDERALAEAHGLTYVCIPIGSPADLSTGNAKKLWDAVQAAPGKSLIHCASGNRVGALWALANRHAGSASAADALAAGRAAGLTALEGVVRTML
jgi:uncharacterized protein (TIGR01244 family)